MAVARVTEITAAGSSLEDAINNGMKRSNDTLRNVVSAWVQDINIGVENGKVSEYRVNMKVTFMLDD